MEKNPTYPPGVTIFAKKKIKDNWECKSYEYVTGKIFQNAVNNMLIKAVPVHC